MPSIVAYHRPTRLDEAVNLLIESNRLVLAGGTAAVPRARADGLNAVEFVDLQALGLDRIDNAEGRVTLGAMVRLGDMADSDSVGSLPARLARRELPSIMRDQATIGGTVAEASPDSVLLAGLLVHDARVEFHDHTSLPLALVLDDGPGDKIIVAVDIDPTGDGAISATGRTPADVPIVAAVARSTTSGIRVALTGVAAAPIEVDPSDPTADLMPTSDFRGSSDYRLELAETLVRRAVGEVS